MDQFTYLADPRTALEMHNSAYLEQVKKAEWRNARHLEELQRSRHAGGPVTEILETGPRSHHRFAWPSWRGVLQSLHLAGSVR